MYENIQAPRNKGIKELHKQLGRKRKRRCNRGSMVWKEAFFSNFINVQYFTFKLEFGKRASLIRYLLHQSLHQKNERVKAAKLLRLRDGEILTKYITMQSKFM